MSPSTRHASALSRRTRVISYVASTCCHSVNACRRVLSGDEGWGMGARHQTGWTGLVAKLLQQRGQYRDRSQMSREHSNL
jgi:hypothetical protein